MGLYTRCCFRRLLQEFILFSGCCLECMILHTIIWIIHTPEVLIIWSVVAMTVVKVLLPSPKRAVRNIAGGERWPILIPLFGKRNKPVCGIINALWHGRLIGADANIFAFKRCATLPLETSIFSCLITYGSARAPEAMPQFHLSLNPDKLVR